MRRRVFGLIVGLATISSAAAQAGGAWVPEAGAGYLQLGYSVKTADQTWSPRGTTRTSSSWHIFRYVYTGGEVGLGKDFSLNFLVLYLDGLEGPRGDMEHNAGFSESFFGLNYQLTEGTWPTALSLRHRSSYLYDLPGAYDRHLHDEDGNFNGVSSEWRGLLGEDYGLFFLASKSLFDLQGWANFEVGYNYRTTNLSDEIPLYFELGYPLPWQELKLKGSYRWVQSVGNDDDERLPNDRFGCSANNCFPDASIMVVGASLLRDFGPGREWWAELGWNQWVWGRSARQYEEPYLAFGRRF